MIYMLEKLQKMFIHQKRIFSIVTGMTIGDYIRYRRLTLADVGREAMRNNIAAVEQFEKILRKEI